MKTLQALTGAWQSTSGWSPGPGLAPPAGRHNTSAQLKQLDQAKPRAQSQKQIHPKPGLTTPRALVASSELGRRSLVRGGLIGLVGTLIADSDIGKAANAQATAATALQAQSTAPVGFTLPQAREAAGQALQTLREARQELIQISSCLAVDTPNECLNEVTARTARAQLQHAEDAGRMLVKTLPVVGAEVAMHPNWSSSLGKPGSGKGAGSNFKSQVVTALMQAVDGQVKNNPAPAANSDWYTEAERMTDAAVLAASAVSGLASRAIEGGKPTVIVEGTTNEIAAAGAGNGGRDLVATPDGPLLQAALGKLDCAISRADALVNLMPVQM